MKNKEIDKLSVDELKNKINSIKKDLFNFRFRKINGQLEERSFPRPQYGRVHLFGIGPPTGDNLIMPVLYYDRYVQEIVDIAAIQHSKGQGGFHPDG